MTHPQIVDGNRPLRLGKDELLRRALVNLRSQYDNVLRFILVASQFELSEGEAVQLLETYGIDAYRKV